MTLNFYNKEITLLRFGWIDFDDWRPQKSASGQAATLKEEVYKYKLISIKGTYVLNAPLEILSGIGETAKNELNKNGFITVSDLLKIDKSDKFYKYSKLAKIYKSQFSD